MTVKLFAVIEKYRDAENKDQQKTRFILANSKTRAVTAMREEIFETHPLLEEVDIDALKITAKQVTKIDQISLEQRKETLWWDPSAALEHEPEKFGFTPRSALRAIEKLKTRKNAR
jgi:hypothetical protein